MHPLDPYRAATVLIRQMGTDAAEDHVRDRQLELLGEHDSAGAAAWVLVHAAIRELGRTRRNDGEALA
jgi:hypothetical protein